MKKLIALLLAAVMVLGLVACGGSSAPAATPDAPAADAPAADTGKVDVASMTEKEKAAAEAEIRLALSKLIDRNYIIEKIAQGGQTPASSFVPAGMTDVDGSQFYENAGGNDFAGYWNTATFIESVWN